jgi:TatD DNase family protein
MNSPAEVAEILQRAGQADVKRAICIGAIDGDKAATQAVEIAKLFNNVWATIGIHPHDADSHQSLESIAHLAYHPKVVAIGETGLDYFRDWADFENQKTLFRNTIAFAREVKKPLVIHCRDAIDDVLSILGKTGAEHVGGVVHCYGEDAETAGKLRDLNFLISVTGTITFKNSEKLRTAVGSIPLEQLMLETDSPYMAPVPHRGKPSEPAHVRLIAEQIADLKSISLNEVARTTSRNADKLFKLTS